jgi:threonyl-tRNA synthetase
LPKGTQIRERLQNFLRNEQEKLGYQMVVTPHIGSKELYVTSGHYAKYGEDSFQPIKTPKENEEFLLKPMNCPHHCEIFANRPRSYKELPLKIGEFGTVYRYEQSGELHGLSRVRGFTQDDAHIFCTIDQVKGEFLEVLSLTTMVLDKIGFEYTAQISLRDPETPEKYIGSDENWDAAELAIIEATKEVDIVTTTKLGEAAFYGPKLDFMIRDALGRKWQLGTIQVDYNLPERFELEYIGSDNQPHRPVMIHRAPFGSMERFMSILIEHTAGKFPLWLTPDQYVLVPVDNKFLPYCEEVKIQLAAKDIRGFIDDRNETIGKKIRDNELKKIPFLLIVGEKEIESHAVAVRKQGEGDLGEKTVDEFIKYFEALL